MNKPTDWQALCAELHAAFNTYFVGEEHHRLLVRVATALARPETPSRLHHCPTHGQQPENAWGCPECVREMRQQLAQPEPEGPTDEELLDAHDQAVAAFPPIHPEAEPLSAVEYARELEIRKARAVLARWGRPTIEPVPVGERLPGAEDCDAEGRCWLRGNVEGDWRLMDPSNTGVPQLKYCFSHWLPHHALPVPAILTKNN